MTIKPIILAPREQFTDKDGNIARSWWRALNTLFNNSGTLASPLVTTASAVLSAADLSSGGTISAPDMPAETLLGNATATAAQPGTVEVGSSLAFNSGTINLASLPAGTLLGNGGSLAAVPSEVAIGSNLTLASGTLSVSDSIDTTYAYTIRDTRGQVNDATALANEALTLAVLGGSGTSGGAGTITVAADSLFGNAGTVAAAGQSISVGYGLTLTTLGTLAINPLTAPIWAPLVNGDLPGPTLIADPLGQCIMVEIR
jgi:hypothetical protein